ncbi:MAG TPA: CRTAC1 family protein [Acidobacteriota bacterium]|nr:CRTAC1 family protein [Acidobacteriota bacterium]
MTARFDSKRGIRYLGWLLPLFLAVGCSPSEPTSAADPSPDLAATDGFQEASVERETDAPEVWFTDVTAESGLDFHHFNAATPAKLLPETMGSGVAFFDCDADGYPDLFFANGAPLTDERTRGELPTQRLYKNIGGRHFENVTAGSGLDETYFGMGVAVGDIDNDGLLDLAVTATDYTRLYKNLGGCRFREITREVGLDCPGYGSSLAFLDYDRDGYLDLFISRYVEWTAETDIPCRPDGTNRTYCTPEVYPPIPNCLFRNLAGRRFQDVSEVSGIASVAGKGLGVVVLDFNDDGWPDIAVANDTVGNFLFENQGDGTFSEVGVDSGLAYSESGAARGGMGIDAADLDGDGGTDVVIGNFSQEMAAVYRWEKAGYFIDDAAQVGIGIPTLMTLAFGTLIEDFNNDGWADVLLANGHIEPNIAATRRSQRYRQPPQLFSNVGQGRFELIERFLGDPEERLLVSRGLASADFNRDGSLDFVISQNGGPAYLFRNERRGKHWLRLQLEGVVSNRAGYGSRVEAIFGGRRVVRFLNSGRSYLSACEPIVHLGLADAKQVDRLEVRWPSGRVTVLHDVGADQTLRIVETH